MRDLRDEAQRGFPLSLAGDPVGVSCDENGPSLGPIRLLDKTNDIFAPPAEEGLDAIFGAIYGKDFSSARLRQGLAAVARALNDGQMARATFSTQHLRLSSLSPEEGERATILLRKASADDPRRPGWPAGTPDSKGGQFRPKDGDAETGAARLAADVTRKAAEEKIRKRIMRRTVRVLIGRLVTWRRAFRLAAEIGSNAVPVLDVAGDAALVADIAEAASEVSEVAMEAEKATAFLDAGPRTLAELRASPDGMTFSSFDAFKKVDLDKFAGPAGEGYEWHHIVEQGAARNLTANEVAQLQSTDNIVRIPKALHEMITSDYAKADLRGVTFRNSLSGKTYAERFAEGLNKLEEFNILRRQ